MVNENSNWYYNLETIHTLQNIDEGHWDTTAHSDTINSVVVVAAAIVAAHSDCVLGFVEHRILIPPKKKESISSAARNDSVLLLTLSLPVRLSPAIWELDFMLYCF